MTGGSLDEQTHQQLGQLWYAHVEAQRQGLAGLQLQGQGLQAAQTSHQEATDSALQAAGKSSLEQPVQAALDALAQMSQQKLAALQASAYTPTQPASQEVVIRALEILPVSDFLVEGSRNLDRQFSSLHHPSSWLMPVDFILQLTWTVGSSSQQHTAQLALDADGPSHFCLNQEPPQMGASTLIHNRCMHHAFAGFVATVPHCEWTQVERQGPTAQNSFFLRKFTHSIRAAEASMVAAKKGKQVAPRGAAMLGALPSRQPQAKAPRPPAAHVMSCLPGAAVKATSGLGNRQPAIRAYSPMPSSTLVGKACPSTFHTSLRGQIQGLTSRCCKGCCSKQQQQ